MREKGELGAVETKVITPEKVVPYKCCLPSSNISLKTSFLTNLVTHFQLLSARFIECGQNVNKHDISWIKLLGEKWVGFM